MSQVTLPPLGEGIDKATVAFWHVKIGDAVDQEDDIVEMVTDKATFNVPAGVTGIVKQILFKEGEDARIGEALAVIEST